MSSGRGPGVIGLLMALLVIGGFGAIYVFVFDKEMQGQGFTIESVVRDQANEIEGTKSQIASVEEMLANGKKVADIKNKLDTVKASIAAAAEKLPKLQEALASTTRATAETEKAFIDYKGQFRTQVRSQAVGEKFPELKTKSGAAYTQVEIRDVTEVGIGIRHEFGMKRIDYEELTPEWQERFQYDPKEKEMALAKEAAAQQAFEKEAEPEVPVAQVMQKIPDGDTEEGREALRRMITAKEVMLGRLRTELGILQGAAVNAEADENIARNRGNNGMDKVFSVRQRIQAKEREIAAVVRELAALKTKVR